MNPKRLAAAIVYALTELIVIAMLLQITISYLAPYAPWLAALYPYLLLFSTGLALLGLQGSPLLAAWPLILWVAAVSFTGEPLAWAPLAVLAAVPLALYYRGGASRAGPPPGEEARLTAKALAVLAGLALGAGLAVYAAYRLYRLLPEAILPRAGGELPAMYEAVGHTLLFQVFTLAIVLYVVYRGVETLMSTLVLAIARPPSLPELEILRDWRKWRDTLIEMKGRQYGVLRWAQLFLLTSLLAPLFLPVTRSLVYAAIPPGTRYATALYIILGYLIGWLFTRTLTAALVDQPRPEHLKKPGRPGNSLIIGFAAASTIIVLYTAAGGDPITLIQETLTGSPTGQDPLADAINIQALENNVLAFAELLRGILEGAVQFLWGG